MVAFQRALYRRVAKLRRLETYGGTRELSHRAVDRTWAHQCRTHTLELDQIMRMLCDRSRTILALRYAGYTWKETARLLEHGPRPAECLLEGCSRVKSELRNGRSARPERPAERDIATTNDPPC